MKPIFALVGCPDGLVHRVSADTNEAWCTKYLDQHIREELLVQCGLFWSGTIRRGEGVSITCIRCTGTELGYGE